MVELVLTELLAYFKYTSWVREGLSLLRALESLASPVPRTPGPKSLLRRYEEAVCDQVFPVNSQF